MKICRLVEILSLKWIYIILTMFLNRPFTDYNQKTFCRVSGSCLPLCDDLLLFFLTELYWDFSSKVTMLGKVAFQLHLLFSYTWPKYYFDFWYMVISYLVVFRYYRGRIACCNKIDSRENCLLSLSAQLRKSSSLR